MSAALWTLILAIVVPVLVQLLKKYQAVFEGNKVLLRLLTIVACAMGAVVVQLSTTGVVDWEVVLKMAAGAVVGAEMTWQWVIKYVQGWGSE